MLHDETSASCMQLSFFHVGRSFIGDWHVLKSVLVRGKPHCDGHVLKPFLRVASLVGKMGFFLVFFLRKHSFTRRTGSPDTYSDTHTTAGAHTHRRAPCALMGDYGYAENFIGLGRLAGCDDWMDSQPAALTPFACLRDWVCSRAVCDGVVCSIHHNGAAMPLERPITRRAAIMGDATRARACEGAHADL